MSRPFADTSKGKELKQMTWSKTISKRVMGYKLNKAAFGYFAVFIFVFNLVAIFSPDIINWRVISVYLATSLAIWLFIFGDQEKVSSRVRRVLTPTVLLSIVVGMVLFSIAGFYLLNGVE